MSELAKLCLYSNLILAPGMLILLFYAAKGNILNIPLTYLAIDGVILCVMTRHECTRSVCHRQEEEEESSGRALERTLQKLDKLRKIEVK